MSLASDLHCFATVGILGGMGPAAGLDLCQKIVDQHSARRDQDHIPFVLYSVPQIPGRTEAILYHGDSPIDAMLEGIHSLSRSGATCVAVACIAAHAWLSDLRAQAPLPVLDIVDAVADELDGSGARTIGLLAAESTHHADIFGSRLEDLGYQFVSVQNHFDHQQIVNEGIRMTKAGNAYGGGLLLTTALEELLESGAQRVILGCTEIPIALTACGSPHFGSVLDATSALADLCIAWSLSQPRHLTG